MDHQHGSHNVAEVERIAGQISEACVDECMGCCVSALAQLLGTMVHAHICVHNSPLMETAMRTWFKEYAENILMLVNAPTSEWHKIAESMSQHAAGKVM